MKRTVEIEFLKAGQPRPYADSEWEAILTFSGEGGWGSPNEQFVKRAAQVLIVDFKEDPNWHDPHLLECSEIEPGKWRVRIHQTFLD